MLGFIGSIACKWLLGIAEPRVAETAKKDTVGMG